MTFGDVRSPRLGHVDTMAPTQLSIVLERLLNELVIADLSTFEAVLMHDTGARCSTRSEAPLCSRRGWSAGELRGTLTFGSRVDGQRERTRAAEGLLR